MSKKLRTVGTPVRDYNGLQKVTGKATYCGDYRIPNMLFGKLLRAPHARATIVSMDISKAEALEGVELVMCYQNCPDEFFKEVVFNGMEVACVVADSKAVAAKALGLIDVEYEVLPFILDPAAAEKEGAIQALPGTPNTKEWDRYRTFTDKTPDGLFARRVNDSDHEGYGDIEEGYRESEVIVQDNGYAYGFATAPLMSNTCCLADFYDETLTLYTDAQTPYMLRQNVAGQFGLSYNRVRIVSRFNGGCFGARYPSAFEAGNCGASATMIAAKASILLGKPVQVEYSLAEDQHFFWSRGSYNTEITLGFKKDGTMKMIDSRIWRNASTGSIYGADTQCFDGTATGTMLYSHNVTSSKYTKTMTHTNGMGWCGWQGYGNPEMFFAMESVVDVAAEKLGIDPIEIRKKNAAQEGDHFLDVYYGYNGPSYLGKSGLIPCIDAVTEKAGWSDKWKAPEEKNGVIRHGIGISLGMMQNGGHDCASQAIVVLNADGSATLFSNYQDIGQGGHGTQVQIVAEALDIDFNKVTMKTGDSDLPYNHFQISSSGTVTQGYATYNAAMDARNKLLKRAAVMLKVSADTLYTKDGVVYSTENPATCAPWINVLMDTMEPGEVPEMDYTKSTMDIMGYGTNNVGPGATACEQAATVVELDVDTETGKISNVMIYHAQDCGRAINPKVVEGHYQGGHHAAEAMTGCEPILDPKTGKLLNDNWIDYPVATFLDAKVCPIIVEVPDPTHPYGASGIGQCTQNSLPGAFANALYNALGIRLKETPFTPARILKALGHV